PQRNALILVDEKYRAFSRIDDFLDLVLAEIGIKAGLLVQPVSLVDDQRVQAVRRALRVSARPFEEVRDMSLREPSGQLALEDFPGRGVARHVVREHFAARELDEQIDRDDGLSGARAALDDQHLLAARARRLREMERRLVDDLLIVDQLKFPVALEQRDEVIDEALRGLELAVVDSVEDSRAVSGTDVAPQEFAQLLDVLPDERRRPRRMLSVEGRADSSIGLQVVQVRAWPRSEEHTSELQSRENLVCRLLLEKKKI